MKALNRIHLQSLRAVDATLRHGSLTLAAAELGVTPGAISQQISKAEAVLGRALFHRHVSGMKPTELGAELAPLLAQGFARLNDAMTRAFDRPEDRLTLSVAPILASRWLIWELPEFHAAHPELRVRLDSDMALVTPGQGDIDACIRVGRGPYSGVHAEQLFAHRAVPVATPDLAAKIKSPEDLACVPVIRETRPMFSLEDWLKPYGMTEADLGQGPEFSDAAMCLDAAISGAGVFLAFEVVAAPALRHGQLAVIPPGEVQTGLAYWFVTAEHQRQSPAVAAFRRWLKDKLAQTDFARP